MLTDEQLHHQVKVIETQLSRAQAAASRGDIPKCQLHMTFALAEFMSAMGSVHNVPIGAFGRHSMGISGEADKPETVPAPLQTPQMPPVRKSLRWEHVPDDFGGKMRLFIGAFDIIGIQQDEDDNERAFYYPTTGWYHLENIVYHPPSQYHNRVEQIDQLMRTPEQAMRWTEEQLKLPILPTWLNGEQVTLAAHPEPQEPYWRESSHQPDFWILRIGRHQIGAVSMQNDDKWFVDGLRMPKPMTFEQARTIVEVAADLRPCRVIQ